MFKQWVLKTIFVVGVFLCADAFAQEAKEKPPLPEGMMVIPAGKLIRGTEPERANQICLENSRVCKQAWFEDEAPMHSVRLKSFLIDIHEVTQQEFRRLTGENPSDFEGANLPVERVTWYEAMDYCNKLGKRLPTEAQWEWAARGGAGSAFSWGERAESEKANFCDRSCPKRWRESQFEDGYRHTAPVGSFPANGYGVFDMAGNVYEWVQDWYDSDYYGSSPNDNPKGPARG